MVSPVTLAVVKGALEHIVDEMDLVLVRGAISPIISEARDMANGIYDPETGETIAQGHRGLPVFLANMQFMVRAVVREATARGGFRPGDLWLTNDVYVAGTHLNDFKLVRPFFHEGALVALLAGTGHFMDTGGRNAGGWAPQATDVHEEGIRLPPLLLHEGGVENRALMGVLEANIRMPSDMRGDLAAMVAALRRGEKRLGELLGRYGTDTILESRREMILRAEREMRSYIAEIPDGVYSAVDHLDNDGLRDVPIRLQVTVEVKGSELTVDFSGSDPWSLGPLNVAAATALSACHIALKHVFPSVSVNGGTYRPVAVRIPEACLLNAQNPKAVSGYLELVGRIVDLIWLALVPAIPEKVPAPCFGTSGILNMSGTHTATGRTFVATLPFPGGYGGSASSDGLVHGTTPQSMATCMPLEASEHRYPIRFEEWSIRPDSGGAGARRGGCGTQYMFRVLADDVKVSVLADRHDYPPAGVLGGRSAAPFRMTFGIGGSEWTPPLRSKVDGVRLNASDWVKLLSPGGGGYGTPARRSPAEIERDLDLGYITPEVAEREYEVAAAVISSIYGRNRYRVTRKV